MIRAVKGTRDLLPPATAVWNQVEARAREVFRRYNYHEIRTPILEETQLFARGVGEETDIVTKEMYTFEDRDGSSLTLRPEATASVMRAYIEHRLDQRPGVQKVYYMGPMFRRERPQKGRYRQFFQIGAEAIGSESPVVDAEVIEMVVEVLKSVGLEGFTLLLNSVGDANCRPAYIAALREKLAELAPMLCEDCQRRCHDQPASRARLQSAGGSTRHRQATVDPGSSCAATCEPHFDDGSSVAAPIAAFLSRVRAAASARPRLLHAHDVRSGARRTRRAEFRAGRRTLRWAGRSHWDRKSPAPGIGFSIGEDRLVMTRGRER